MCHLVALWLEMERRRMRGDQRERSARAWPLEIDSIRSIR